jgi:polysaccharide export outer membrane protein
MFRSLRPVLLALGLLLAAGAVAQTPPADRSRPPLNQGTPGVDQISNPPPVTPSRTEAGSEEGMTAEEYRLERLRERLRQEEEQEPWDPNRISEFQRFIASATGKKLRVFGQGFFRRVPATYAPLDRIPVPQDYIIGPGDELWVRAWGQVEIDYHAMVDRNGNLYVPRIGNIAVAGLRYGQLQPFVRAQIERVFKNFDLDVTVGRVRSVQVYVVGNAQRPGTYTVSSLSTLVNAIFASGGPAASGSMRRIQLKRGNSVVTEFDLYDLMMRGDRSRDVPLDAGDVILFLPVGPQVAVTGSVNVPAVYEIKESSTLGDILQYTGGLTPTAAGQKASIERIDDRKVRSADEFALDEAGLKRVLRDGDLITIRSIVPRFQNVVVLRGNVADPGRYPWKPGMRVSDLIPSREFLLTRDYWEHLALAESGRLQERLEQEKSGAGPLETQLAGSARGQEALTPGVVQGAGQTHRSLGAPPDARGRFSANTIIRSGPDINWDYAVIQRIDPNDLSTDLITFNLGRALDRTSSSDDVVLQPGDIVNIFSQDDMQVPTAKRNIFVRLEGEISAAGVYKAEPGETLRSLVQRAGGLTANAYLHGAEFTRDSVRKQQQSRLDEFIRQAERDVEIATSDRTQNVAGTEDAATLRARLESQRALVERLKELRATGRVILNIKPDQNSVEALPDIILEDGDRLVVPYVPATVNVVGAVYNSNAFLYRPGRTVNDYLRMAGGATRSGDAARTFVILADGSTVAAGRSGGWFQNSLKDRVLMPGDTVVVPEQFNRSGLLKGLKDWSQVFAQFALGAAAIKVLQ